MRAHMREERNKEAASIAGIALDHTREEKKIAGIADCLFCLFRYRSLAKRAIRIERVYSKKSIYITIVVVVKIF